MYIYRHSPEAKPANVAINWTPGNATRRQGRPQKSIAEDLHVS